MPKPIEFGLGRGLLTKGNPRDIRGAAPIRLENADHFDRVGAVGKVPGSTRTSANLGAAVASLHFYGHFDLARRFVREALALAGDTLYRIEEDTGLTALAHGLAPEPLEAITQLDRIHFASPQNTPFKYDGSLVSRWGVEAPGESEVVIDPFDDASLYTINSTNTKSTATDFSQDGACVAVNKVSTTVRTAQITRAGLSINLLPYRDILRVWLFVPPGGLEKLSNGERCAEIQLFDGIGLSRYQKSIGDLHEGWNRLSWVRSQPTDVGGFGEADYSAITGVIASIQLAANTTTQSGFRWDRLHTTEVGAPQASIAGPGFVTGRRRYVAVFLSKYGQRSNAGPVSNEVDAGAGSTIQVQVPISNDPQVTGRLLFADQDGDEVFRLVGSLPDNATAEFLDNVPPAERDSDSPPFAGDTEDDNSPAPRMSQVVLWKNHVFGIDVENPFQLNICAVNEIESWPLLTRPQFDQELAALSPHRLGLMIYTRNPDVAYLMTGNTLSEFRFDLWNPERAAGGKRAAVKLKTLSFYWSDDGPFIDDGSDPWFAAAEIHDRIIAEIEPASVSDAFLVSHLRRRRIVCFIDGKVLVYQFGRAAGVVAPEGGVDPLDVRLGGWSELVLPAQVVPTCAAAVERDADTPELWVGCTDGYVYRLQDPSSPVWAVGVGSAPVAAVFETGRAPLFDGDYHGRPQFLSIAGSAPAATTWTVTVSVYEDATGPLLDSRTLEVTIGPGETSVRTRLPDVRGFSGSWASVTLSHSGVEFGGTIERLALEPVPDRKRTRRAA